MLQDKSREVNAFVIRVLAPQLFATSKDSLQQDLAAQYIQMVSHHIDIIKSSVATGLFGVLSKFASLAAKVHLIDLYGVNGFADGIDPGRRAGRKED